MNTPLISPDKTVSVAPMMDWTDRHDRYFLRLFNPRVRLYTEMITTAALLHGDRERLLGYAPQEHPLAVQLGGSDPRELATCAKMAEDWGYDEVNLNVGCPSDRVQQGKIGACLMAEPALVADCIAAMQAATKIPVTVKHRLGIDDMDSFEALEHFVSLVRQAGCRHFIVHARIAILKGLSPKENRDVPPLRYEDAYRLKACFPDCAIVLNGGIKTVEESIQHLQHVDGIMLGREAYHNPYVLAKIAEALWTTPLPERKDILSAYLPYVDAELARGTPLTQMSRHILGLFQGLPGARRWRQHLSMYAHQPDAGSAVIHQAAQLVGIDL